MRPEQEEQEEQEEQKQDQELQDSIIKYAKKPNSINKYAKICAKIQK